MASALTGAELELFAVYVSTHLNACSAAARQGLVSSATKLLTRASQSRSTPTTEPTKGPRAGQPTKGSRAGQPDEAGTSALWMQDPVLWTAVLAENNLTLPGASYQV